MNAAVRAERAEPAIFALIVDAKDEAAIAFYEHHEFGQKDWLLTPRSAPTAA